jgi:hypothetical protein
MFRRLRLGHDKPGRGGSEYREAAGAGASEKDIDRDQFVDVGRPGPFE